MSSKKGSKSTVPTEPTDEEKKCVTELWGILQPIVRKALEFQSAKDAFMTAYNAVYDRIAYFQPGGKYKFCTLLLKDQLLGEFKSFLTALAAEEAKLSPQGRVEHFGRSWEKWSNSSRFVESLLKKIVQVADDFDIRPMMYSLWRTHMYSAECKSMLVGVVCDIIDDKRHGNPGANLDLVRSLVTSLNVMDETEANALEPPRKRIPGVPVVQRRTKKTESNTLIKQLQDDVLVRTREFYMKEGARLETMSPCDAIKFVNDILNKEKTLLTKYLTTVKLDEVDKVLNDTLINAHLPFFLQGFESIVLSDNDELGKAILTLFQRAKKDEELVKHYSVIVHDHMVKAYEQDLEDAAKDCRKYLQIALSEFNFFRSYTERTFPSGKLRFSEVFREAVLSTLNDNPVLVKNIPADAPNPDLSKNLCCAKFFAEYVHLLMFSKDGKNPLSDTEREEKEKDFITIYEFVKSKKDFLDQYRANLARRLLRRETVGRDLEKAFLEKLKKTGTEESLTQCTTMLKDLMDSEDDSSKFADFAKAHGFAKCPVVPLLCSAAWPISSKARTYRLPEKMEAFAKLYQEFYLSTTNSKNKKIVTLLDQYGRGDLIFHTPAKKYELSGTEFHLMVLPLIRSSKVVSFKEIMEATSLTLDELRFQLAFLIKYGFILAKNGANA